MSRVRKSETTGTPVRSAITPASPICSVLAIGARNCRGRLRGRSSGRGSRSARSSRTHRTRTFPAPLARKARPAEIAAARSSPCSRGIRNSQDRFGARLPDTASDETRRSECARPAISTIATSMPSSDVPLMIPATLTSASAPAAARSAIAAPRWAAARRSSRLRMRSAIS